jgi:hypothetical protein
LMNDFMPIIAEAEQTEGVDPAALERLERA